jgi:predicted nucleic acid-binding Zn ribbon protein
MSRNHRRYEYPCEYCGETMTSTRRDKRFCSESCMKKAQHKRTLGAEREAARANKTCPWCGKVFTPKRSDAVYCSTACNKRGYYRENKAMSLARGRAWVAANPEKRREHLARFAERHPDDGRDRYARLKADPERYAAAQERSRRYYLEHKDEALERAKLQRERWPTRGYNGRHGCDWEELFAQLWLTQDGKCYLCGDALDRDAYRAIHLDHDHSCCPLGKSCAACRRGLACRRCNVLIGWVDHDPDRLRRIADNLEVANAGVRHRMREADQEKRGVLFDLEEPAFTGRNPGTPHVRSAATPRRWSPHPSSCRDTGAAELPGTCDTTTRPSPPSA